MNAPPTMPMLLENASTTSRMVTPETPPISTMEITAVATPTVPTVTTRDQPVLSFTAEITTSMIEIMEVNPATTSPPKNSTPTNCEAGASETMVGKATNASPSPEEATSSTAVPAAVARKPSAANTPMPASNSKEELVKPTTSPEPVALDLRLR